jgi:transcriptional regulator with XRE-family HTH domain
MPSPRGESEASRARALGEQVRTLRRQRSLTQRDLAREVNLSQSSLARLENGDTQSPPPDETIIRLAAALDADVRELLRAAGRQSSGKSFETAVLEQLATVQRELTVVRREMTATRQTLARLEGRKQTNKQA